MTAQRIEGPPEVRLPRQRRRRLRKGRALRLQVQERVHALPGQEAGRLRLQAALQGLQRRVRPLQGLSEREALPPRRPAQACGLRRGTDRVRHLWTLARRLGVHQYRERPRELYVVPFALAVAEC